MFCCSMFIGRMGLRLLGLLEFQMVGVLRVAPLRVAYGSDELVLGSWTTEKRGVFA